MNEPTNEFSTGVETNGDQTMHQGDDLSGLSYETARARLIEVVTQLESGGVPLDESLALWERGERLAEVCQRWLDGAQAKIDAARTDRTSDRTPERPERPEPAADTGTEAPRR